MSELFVKKFWEDENVLFYIHFTGDTAIEQVEITSKGTRFLSLENPIQGDSMLYDQSMEDLELDESDFITREEFNEIWIKK